MNGGCVHHLFKFCFRSVCLIGFYLSDSHKFCRRLNTLWLILL
jgi:hypothetical protein